MPQGGVIAVVLAALVPLSGCLGEDEKEPSQPAGKAETSAEPQSTATTPGGEQVEVPEEAIATRDGTIGDTPVKLELLELKRGGETLVLTLRLSTEGESGIQVGETFDDGVQQQVEGATNADAPVNLTSMDAITLIDTKNRKRYLVGHDSKGVCTCDSGLGALFLSSAGPAILSATYAAPPEDVSTIDVLVPRFGTFKDVPIS